MIGLLEIRRKFPQFALIALVVTLISYLVMMINGLGVGLNEAAGSALRSFDADAIAYSDQSGLSVIRSELGQEVVDTIAAAEGVQESAPVGYLAVNYRNADDEIDSAAFLGFDPGTIAEPAVVSGDALTPGESDGVLADRLFLRASGLSVGDQVEVSLRLNARTFTIVGEVDEGQFFFQPTVYLLRSSWQELKYEDPANAPVASIMLLKGEGLPGTSGDGFEAVSKSTAFANIEGVSGQQSTVVALRLFGYVIGALVIGVFFYVITLQKVPQIGVLKAIGASNFFVFRQIVMQVVVLAAIGIAIAVPLAWATNRALQQIPESVPITLNGDTYLTTSLALLATSLVGALFSGRQVVKTDPIIALGQQQ